MIVLRKYTVAVLSVVLGVFCLPHGSVSAGTKTTASVGTFGMFVGGYLTAQLCCGNSLADVGMFLNELRKNPSEMGALGPCSPYVGRAVVGCIPEKIVGVSRKFLEVGAGTGAISAQLIRSIEADDTVDLVEMQKPLCEMLTKKFCATKKGAEQVKVHCMPIQQFKSAHKYDSILISVPFLACPFEVVKDIWEHVLPLLADGGTVSYVWHAGLIPVKTKFLEIFNPEKKKEFEKVTNYLDSLNSTYGAKCLLVKRNVSPLYVRHLKFEKPSELAGKELVKPAIL